MSNPFEVHGAFSWSELMTHDVDGAKRFYGALFGWTLEPMAMAQGTYWVIKANGAPVGGIMAMPREMSPPAWGVYITVSNVDETAKQALALGGLVVVPPTDIPGVGRFCVIRDPQGAMVQAITYTT